MDDKIHSSLSSFEDPEQIIFQEGLPFNCMCPKCEQALQTPVKTPCGHHFCKSCINADNYSTTCYVCHSIIPKGNLIVDKEKHREVQNLPVKCLFSNKGCEWVGALKELQTHLTDCNNRRIVCINGCGELIPLYQKEDHIIECRKKVAKCSYCHNTVKTEMLKSHLKNCPRVIISCPFQCGLIDRPRNEIQQHHFSCPNASNVCPFAAFGCTYTGEKYDVQKHLSEEPIRHLIYLCDELTELKGYYTMIQNDMDGIKSRHSELIQKTISCEEMYGAQLVWRIDNVAQKQNEAKSGAHDTIFSRPFVSGRHGYKLIASACLFGDGLHRGQQLALYVTICHGEYDALLEWPFTLTVTFTLLDQNPQFEERIDISYIVDTQSILDKEQYLSRPTSEKNAAFGAQAFCSLDILENYIKDDAMFVKIKLDIPDFKYIQAHEER